MSEKKTSILAEDKKKSTLYSAFLNTVPQVWYCEHIMDNTFISCSFSETQKRMDALRFRPVGVCLEPEYSPSSGIGLVFENERFETGWVHVNHALVMAWLKELHMLPPEDIIWDWEVIVRHVWKGEIVNDAE